MPVLRNVPEDDATDAAEQPHRPGCHHQSDQVVDQCAHRLTCTSVRLAQFLNVSQEVFAGSATKEQLPVLRKLLPVVIILVAALPVPLVGDVSRVPGGVQVMVKMTHVKDEPAIGVLAILLDLGNRPVEFLSGFLEMKENGSAIHTDSLSNSGW